jgi:hypothetical protein
VAEIIFQESQESQESQIADSNFQERDRMQGSFIILTNQILQNELGIQNPN